MERGSGVWGVWEASSRVQVLVFFFLKEASSRNKIQKPVNLQHNDSGVSRLPIQAAWTIPQYVCELMNYSGSYANRTMKRDTVHVLKSVFGRLGVFLWECESPKVGTGQPSHPCPVFLPEWKIRSGEVVNKMLQ